MSENKTFDGLGIAPEILKRLSALNFSIPTPIQYKTIPIAVTGEDVIGIAQTGTGKTLAFAVPMIQRLKVNKKRGLILVPTRELAMQVNETVKKLAEAFGLKTLVVIGGESMQAQVRVLRGGPDIIVATPGRLIDHLQNGFGGLSKLDVLVLDEADRMLDMGFAPQLKQILLEVPKERQTMLFSATMPASIAEIAVKHMNSPLRVEIAPAGTSASLLEQELFIVSKPQKMALLERLLAEHKGTVLVFSRTKHGAKKMVQTLSRGGRRIAELHANRSLNQRIEALSGFKSGKYRILVATDIAARGIDVSGIELVVNFDLPDNTDDYVHRIGRTARAGKSGKAISFAAPEQKKDVEAIERLIRVKIPVLSVDGMTEKEFSASGPPRGMGGAAKRHFSSKRTRPRSSGPSRRRRA